ncbi:hypothetical protein ACRXCV_00495 (plasmid) [Halobacteriovorax sp. GFR7]|uniref:hypothetical protein n=1 Tax=unclassified Halobacteriovorax TaxID=2639665 RepID=UPI003D95856E
MTHDEAIQRVLPMGGKSRANGKGFTAHLSFYEVMGGNGRNRESPDVIFFRSDGVTDLIEVKVDRTDFLRDKKKDFRKYPKKGMGRYRYYACPEHLIKPEDLPDGWGLIWIPEEGEPYFKIKSSEFESNYLAERDLLFSLMRRCNDYVPLTRLVEYDKIVKRHINSQMTKGSTTDETVLLGKVRQAYWEKFKKLIKSTKR